MPFTFNFNFVIFLSFRLPIDSFGDRFTVFPASVYLTPHAYCNTFQADGQPAAGRERANSIDTVIRLVAGRDSNGTPKGAPPLGGGNA
jgi:hypothetical protein